MQKVLFLTAILSLGIVGCGTTPHIQTAEDYKGKVVILGSKAKQHLEAVKLSETPLPEGRLQVKAVIENKTNKRFTIKVRCKFEDETNFPTGDETPFQHKPLLENGQETFLFKSIRKAENYTVEVALP